MSIQQKMRSLYCKVPAGLGFEELNGEQVIYVKDVPFELEDTCSRWILRFAAPDMIRSAPKNGPALTEQGWEAFISWVLDTLAEAQEKWPHE